MNYKHYTFTDFLKDRCEAQGGYEGKTDDEYEEAFESWLEFIDPALLIEYGDQYGEMLAIRLIDEMEARYQKN